MAYCKHCGAQIQDRAVICPHCRQRQVGGSGGKTALVVVAIGCGALALVAFVGIVAAIFIPNFLDALQKAKQKRTLADVRLTGTALMSWLADEVGGSGGSGVMPPEHPSAEELSAILVPKYLQQVPATDGWGHPFEYWISPNLLLAHVFQIRSPGRDGVFSTDSYDSYEPAPFLATDYDQDVVWADGYFVHWPDVSPR